MLSSNLPFCSFIAHIHVWDFLLCKDETQSHNATLVAACVASQTDYFGVARNVLRDP